LILRRLDILGRIGLFPTLAVAASAPAPTASTARTAVTLAIFAIVVVVAIGRCGFLLIRIVRSDILFAVRCFVLRLFLALG
jgi:hypothetical protein